MYKCGVKIDVMGVWCDVSDEYSELGEEWTVRGRARGNELACGDGEEMERCELWWMGVLDVAYQDLMEEWSSASRFLQFRSLLSSFPLACG